ncbi:dienelactone hydrolase family protein [Nocardioides sp.]|uniref:dienelactone hydrolase family protein n=1 Tax=Nocardioides sp. TaxID=35761 RepID=UPI002619763A|nr:dienelactone hydrolase family protein [Nocardioides sp.]
MADTIEISTPDGAVEAYLGCPEGAPRGGILFFMDAFGLRGWIGEMVDEIASWGYVVLAPNVFHRDGTVAELVPPIDLMDPAERGRFFAELGGRERIAHLTPELAARDLPAYVATLQQYAGTGAPLGTTGYCMGARLALRAAGQSDLFRAVGGFHGGSLVTDDPASPHTTVRAGVTYLFGHADQDGSMTPADGAVLDDALRAVGAPFTSAFYPGGTHGYTMRDTSNWHEPSYQRHCRELRELFADVLG